MHRRQVIAGIGSLAALGAGGAIVLQGQGQTSGDRLESVTVDPLQVPSSPDEPFAVPFTDTVTYIDLFATWCTPCIDHMETLRTVHSEFGDSVRFVSVTNQAIGGELTRADVRDWWAEYGGSWAAGFDDEGSLTRATGSKGMPHNAIVDADGRLAWTKTGTPDAETVKAQIERVRSE